MARKYQKGQQAGFTLVEILVALVVFGLLAIIGTDFFLQVVKSSNQATMKNEVRQNAVKILQDITGEIRKSNWANYNPNANALSLTYPDSSQTTTYIFNTNGSVQKTVNTGAPITTTLTSNTVAVLDCSGTCGNCNTPGIHISPMTITPSVAGTITIIVQQNPTRFSTTDYCTRFVVTDSAVPRQY